MRNARLLTVCAAATLASAALAQTTLRNDTVQAEDTIRTWIATEFGRRGPEGKTSDDPLRHARWHFVFLVNTTNFARRSAYAQFVQNTIQRFLTRQAELSEGDPKDRFSVYTYQLSLNDARPSLKDKALDGAAIETFRREFPSVPERGLQVGHDNAGSRRALLQKLGDPDQDRPIVMIQFTDIAINEAPKNQPLDRRIRALNGQTGALDGLPWFPYETPGQPFSAFDGKSTYDVHVWLYGPARFSRAQLVVPVVQEEQPTPEPAPVQEAEPAKEETPSRPILPLIGGIVAALAVLAGLALAAKTLLKGKSYRVTIGSELPVTLTKGESRKVCGQDAQVSGPVYTLSEPKAPAAALLELTNVSGGVRYRPLAGEIKMMPDPPNRVLTPGNYEVFIKLEDFSKTLRLIIEAVEESKG
ncbi:MAG: hypothetical protein WHU10_00265 [Fimbriimonadales bacterium]